MRTPTVTVSLTMKAEVDIVVPADESISFNIFAELASGDGSVDLEGATMKLSGTRQECADALRFLYDRIYLAMEELSGEGT